jgi:hypothetical protein
MLAHFYQDHIGSAAEVVTWGDFPGVDRLLGRGR